LGQSSKVVRVSNLDRCRIVSFACPNVWALIADKEQTRDQLLIVAAELECQDVHVLVILESAMVENEAACRISRIPLA
jgi:hypothetical protein